MNFAIDILPYILDLAAVGLTTLLGAATRYFLLKTSNDKVAQAAFRAEQLTAGIIYDIKQTLVDELKANGKWDRSTASAMKRIAVNRVQKQAKKELKLLTKSMGDKGTSFISSLIESAVAKAK